MISEIAVIAPDVGLMAQFEKIRQETVIDFSLHKGLVDEAVDVAREAVAQGAKVLISRGETTQLIRAAINVPVADIPITVHDIIPLIDQARKYSSRIAVVGFGEIFKAAQVAAPILSVELGIFKLASTKDIPGVVAEIRDQGYAVMVGNPQSTALAESFGILGFGLRTPDSALLATLEEAAKLSGVVRRENEWRLRQQVFIDSTREGVLVLDGQGSLLHANQLVHLDPDVENALFVREGEAYRLRPGEILDAVRGGGTWSGVVQGKKEGLEYLCRVHPVAREGQNFGAVVLLEPERQGNSERRRDIFQKGLVAQHRFDDIIHAGSAMRDLITRAGNYAAADSTILILGECGTGKELIAQSLHNASRRRHGPFVAVNCSALPENLLESELFGYTDGAFTGARKGGRKGLFEMADGGTIFLDEIAEMVVPMQVKLLRVLEERMIMRLGGDRLIPVDVRVLCATNKNLPQLAAEGRFRQDLYFRINVLRLTLPPLRERGECLDALIRHYSQEIGYRLGGPPPELGAEAWEVLRAYSFPGNIREMKSILERIMVDCWGREVTREDILKNLEPLQGQVAAEDSRPDAEPLLRREEMRLIYQTLDECGGSRAETAKRLGISTSTLWRRLGRNSPRQ
jgi:transcriptional regulator with PAS, ATPase and Fis domain